MTGKAFESHLKEKDTAEKAKEEKEKEGNTAKKTKQDVKEIAYTEIASSLDTNIKSIKAKINGLRVQLGRVRSTKPKVDRVQMSTMPPVGSTTITCLFSCL